MEKDNKITEPGWFHRLMQVITVILVVAAVCYIGSLLQENLPQHVK